jgi:hypothetical protein
VTLLDAGRREQMDGLFSNCSPAGGTVATFEFAERRHGSAGSSAIKLL